MIPRLRPVLVAGLLEGDLSHVLLAPNTSSRRDTDLVDVVVADLDEDRTAVLEEFPGDADPVAEVAQV